MGALWVSQWRLSGCSKHILFELLALFFRKPNITCNGTSGIGSSSTISTTSTIITKRSAPIPALFFTLDPNIFEDNSSSFPPLSASFVSLICSGLKSELERLHQLPSRSFAVAAASFRWTSDKFCKSGEIYPYPRQLITREWQAEKTPNGRTSPPDLNCSGNISNALAGPLSLHMLYQYAKNMFIF